MTHSIRPAAAADIAELVELMREFYAESGYDLDRQWAAAAFAGLLGERRLGGAWLAWQDDRPIGYVVLTVRFSMELGGLDGFVDDFFVRPKYRRRGVGSALLGAIVEESASRGVLAVHVETVAGTPAAVLYQKLGWQARERPQLLLARRLA